MKSLLLGIDIGTSACKVAVFDRGGNVIASSTKSYQVYYPQAGWAEQNPDEWWEAVCLATKEILEQGTVQADAIKGVGIDGQSWSAIPINERGEVLTNTPIWMDTRAQALCDRMNAKIGRDPIFEVAGNALQPSYTTAKIIWYRENKPDIYPHIYKVLQSNGFIVYRLTGVCSHDLSQGYGMHCFNMREGTWDEEMCKALTIPFNYLADLYPSHQVVGGITEEAAKATGLMKGTPVVAGGLDAACGALGAGVLHTGDTQEQGGQAGGMSICMDTYRADPRMILGYHVVPGKWLLQGGTTGGGGVMRWLESELGDYERSQAEKDGNSSLQQFNTLAEKVSPGSDGLVFLPYMAGERSPIWDPHAKGVFYGLDFSKTKGHMIRSAMEGVAFSLKHNLDIAEEIGAEVQVLRAMGGAANSQLWTQIKSDITDKPIVVPASDTATTLGAALLAGVGTGMYKDFDEAIEATIKITRNHEPHKENKSIYQKNYKTYLEIYKSLKQLMRRNGGDIG